MANGMTRVKTRMEVLRLAAMDLAKELGVDMVNVSISVEPEDADKFYLGSGNIERMHQVLQDKYDFRLVSDAEDLNNLYEKDGLCIELLVGEEE